jgi:hypothetical protein
MMFTKVGFYTASMKLMMHEELSPLFMASVRLISIDIDDAARSIAVAIS